MWSYIAQHINKEAVVRNEIQIRKTKCFLQSDWTVLQFIHIIPKREMNETRTTFGTGHRNISARCVVGRPENLVCLVAINEITANYLMYPSCNRKRFIALSVASRQNFVKPVN